VKFLQGIKIIKQKTRKDQRKGKGGKESKAKMGRRKNSYTLKLRQYKKSKQKQYR
jgi:hypothetical protein